MIINFKIKDGQLKLENKENRDNKIINYINYFIQVALACHYRLAVNDKRTKLGLPEVKIGLLPGGGGTQRLPQLISLPTALDAILTGKNIQPDKAKKLGLVDIVVNRLGPGIQSPEEK